MLQPFLEDLVVASSVKVVQEEAQFSTLKDPW